MGEQKEGSVSDVALSLAGDEEEEPDPTQIALPTLLMAGTIFGAIFRADLSKNKVDVETNNLRRHLCNIAICYSVYNMNQ